MKRDVALWYNHTPMTKAEAQAYWARDVARMTREKAADYLDKNASTIDSQLSSARQKARLPEIDEIDTMAETLSGDPAVVVHIGGGARVRYRTDTDDELHEEIFTPPGGSGRVRHDTLGPAGGGENVREKLALSFVAGYVNQYREDPMHCRDTRPKLWEAITGYSAEYEGGDDV